MIADRYEGIYGGKSSQINQNEQLAELEAKLARIKDNYNNYMNMNIQVPMSHQQMEKQVQKPMIWLEIGKELETLTEIQQGNLFRNKEYEELANEINLLMQNEYINLMMPLVEKTEKGKELIEKQLKLVKSIKRDIVSQTNKELDLLNLFKSKYSHLSWNDFIEKINNKEI